MILELLSAGLIISACLAIFLDEAVYSVTALAGTFILVTIIYALSGAPYVALFQFAVAVGTISILFLSGEMLSEKPTKKTDTRRALTVLVAGAVLSVPMIVVNLRHPPTSFISTSDFGFALWDLRAADVVLQGLVVMTVAIGILIAMYQKTHAVQGKVEQ